MDFLRKTVDTIFSMEGARFRIADYQQAYSWGKSQCKRFYNALYTQSENENHYFLGNIVLESSAGNDVFEIVDGQRRIMTVVIFISAIIDILEKRQETETFSVDINRLKQIYSIQTTAHTPKKLMSAKNYFLQKLNSIKDTAEIIRILNKLEQSPVTAVIFDCKADTAFFLSFKIAGTP
jgi:uncharacterized protein with ParB-like and HNH nuclease domain